MSRGEELFYRWAPPDSVWAPWQKPVLFTQIPGLAFEAAANAPAGGGVALPPADAAWAPAPTQRTALVIDLPADEPLMQGVALAGRGYQPVVLYNCCPGASAVLDLNRVIEALIRGGDALARGTRPRPDAPPAFLIDARRSAGDRKPAPGLFDNRWVVLPQDFPSGTFLKANGIDRVLLLHDRDGQPREDLAHVLLRWQEAGLGVAALRPGGAAAELRVSRPSRFRAAWYTLLVTFGLRPNSAGGFGSVVPMPSSGGG
jgi:hypothetical protein